MLFHVEMGNPVCPPFWGGFAHEIVVEKLAHTDGVIFLVWDLAETVVFPLVLEHHHGFAEPPQCIEIFDALVPVHGSVLVVVQDDRRGLDVFCIVDRRIACVGVEIFPEATGEPSLAAFKNRLVG